MTLATVPALDEHRTTRISPLLSPALLRHELPIDSVVAETVTRARAEVVDILDGRDDRLIVVVGPCSIHDPDAALDYAHRLAEHTSRVSGELRVVMLADVRGTLRAAPRPVPGPFNAPEHPQRRIRARPLAYYAVARTTVSPSTRHASPASSGS